MKTLNFSVLFASLLSLSLFFSLFASAGSMDLTKRLTVRNEVNRLDLKLFHLLYEQDTQDRLSLWINHRQNREYIVSCQQSLKGFIKSEKILSLLCYSLRAKDASEKLNLVSDLLDRYMLEKKMILLELKDDIRYDKFDLKYRAFASVLFNMYSETNTRSFKSCFKPLINIEMDSAFVEGNTLGIDFFSLHSSQIYKCMKDLKLLMPTSFGVTKTTIFSFSGDFFPYHPGHAISETGWINGNKVQYLAYNDTSVELMEKVALGSNLVMERFPLLTDGSLSAFLTSDLSEDFNHFGFTTFENDPVWNSSVNSVEAERYGDIFKELKNAINQAEESIFIDIFFLGGNMGQSLAKRLIERAEEGIQILIIKDVENHFGLKAHMEPVFNYLSAYMMQKSMKGEKSNLLIAPSYILGHKSGLPRVLSRVLKNNIVEAIGLKDHLPLHPNATSDHSKVMVIDGKRSVNGVYTGAKAFVGSKNWTDQSGALCWDEVAKIEGPAASVILDDYYLDMFYAFKMNVSSGNLKIIADAHGINKDSKEKIIAELLKPFDLLNRNENHKVSTSTNVLSETKSENTVLRTGYNNFNSTRTNTVDEVVQSILMARKKILIKDQYLFDRNVVKALIKVKKERSSLDIRIVVNDFLPNYIYADMLAEVGIELRFKKFAANPKVAQEFHMKTISVDSESVITGSANKDQTTMYGSFREEQVQLIDKKAVAIHDETFENIWNDTLEVTESFTEFSYDSPKELRSLKGMKGQNGIPLTPGQTMKVLRTTLSVLYDSLGL